MQCPLWVIRGHGDKLFLSSCCICR